MKTKLVLAQETREIFEQIEFVDGHEKLGHCLRKKMRIQGKVACLHGVTKLKLLNDF